MKLISFVIPSYNSENYLHQAVDSLLDGGQDIEIIIVNDGSKDKTLLIAKKYQKKYPQIIRVVDKENGGHGSAINAGLAVAKGLFFKVIDSDDWVDQKSLKLLLDQIKKHHQANQQVDLYITNFVYEHVEDQTRYERDYSSNFPADTIFEWNQLRRKFRYSKTLLMHALIYRTQILTDMKLRLPEHTFYVDNIVAYLPLPFVKKLYYIKLPFYRYFIGRSDQSVTLKNITARYQQQHRVFKAMSDAYSYHFLNQLPKKLRNYMKHDIVAMMIITQMFTVADDSRERRNDLKNLWTYIKDKDIKLYRFLKYRSYNTWVHFLPWRIKSFVMVKGYLYLVKKVKLG